MNIRKTKPLRFSIILYQRRRHLTHALSVSRTRVTARHSHHGKTVKISGQTIIKKYIERIKENGRQNASALLRFLKSPRAQKELDASANRAIDSRLNSEYRYYRSRPSLAFHMNREITRQLICHNPQQARSLADSDAKARLRREVIGQAEQQEETKIIREEFVLTPQLLRVISDKVSAGIFRSMELERLRGGI